MDASESTIRAGSILLWYGSTASIPGGWALCDGNNGTPDLRNRFIVGAGDTYAVGATGGSLTHNHSFAGGGHIHALPAGAAIAAGTDFASSTASSSVSGNTGSGANAPPYHALCYIMKL